VTADPGAGPPGRLPSAIRMSIQPGGGPALSLAAHRPGARCPGDEPWTRRRTGRDLGGLIHHSDKGVQCVAVRYTQRLAEAAAAPSVGSTGDSYDCEHRQRAGRGVQLPFHGRIGCATAGPGRASTTSTAVAEYIDRFNHRRLHGEIGLVPPAERRRTPSTGTTSWRPGVQGQGCRCSSRRASWARSPRGAGCRL
jgi:hypothetical protein